LRAWEAKYFLARHFFAMTAADEPVAHRPSGSRTTPFPAGDRFSLMSTTMQEIAAFLDRNGVLGYEALTPWGENARGKVRGPQTAAAVMISC
jgi:hypothetical protein